MAHRGTLQVITSDRVTAIPIVKAVTWVGRDETVDVRIPEASVSRRHFAIHCESSRVSISDFSTAGTLVNQRLVKSERVDLNSGDTISFKTPLGLPHFRITFNDVVAGDVESPTGASAEQGAPRNEQPNVDEEQGIEDSDDELSNRSQLSRSRSDLRLSSGSETSIHSTLNSIVDAVVCSICMELAHDAVSPCQCLHTFCGGCLSAWIFRSGSPRVNCPKCRTSIRSVTANHVAASIASELEKIRPADAKSAEDKASLDTRNRFPGKKIFHLADMFVGEYGGRTRLGRRRRRMRTSTSPSH